MYLLICHLCSALTIIPSPRRRWRRIGIAVLAVVTRKIERIAQNKPPVELTPQGAASPDAAHPEMKRAAADLGSQGITRGNALKFHANGEEAFADLMALIDSAEKSISIETYELKGDETGKAIVDRLIARANAGVEVRLLVDGFDL